MCVCGHELEQSDGHGHADEEFVAEREDDVDLERAPFAPCGAGAGEGRGFIRVRRGGAIYTYSAGADEGQEERSNGEGEL